ncbi:hypothetical protein ACNKHV_16955 [Shigella flexneri]
MVGLRRPSTGEKDCQQDATIPLTLIAADSIDEYNKPDLSHVISQGQRADDLTRQTAGEIAEQFNLRRFRRWVTDSMPKPMW